MAETITIRALGPDDADVLDRVRPGTFDNPIDPAQTWAFLATGVNAIVVGMDRGEVVGFASGNVLLHPDKPRGFFVNEVGVHQDVRGSGLGSRLMKALTEIALERGCSNLWVATAGDNLDARSLYRRLGGRESPGIAMYSWDLTEL